MPYILEVQQFFINGHIKYPGWNGTQEHIGYMNKLFKTKQDACDYYHIHNEHMRHITIEYDWKSDWDPFKKTLLILTFLNKKYYV